MPAVLAQIQRQMAGGASAADVMRVAGGQGGAGSGPGVRSGGNLPPARRPAGGPPPVRPAQAKKPSYVSTGGGWGPPPTEDKLAQGAREANALSYR